MYYIPERGFFFSPWITTVKGVSQTPRELYKHVLSRAYLQAGRRATLPPGSFQQHHPGGGSHYVFFSFSSRSILSLALPARSRPTKEQPPSCTRWVSPGACHTHSPHTEGRGGRQTVPLEWIGWYLSYSASDQR